MPGKSISIKDDVTPKVKSIQRFFTSNRGRLVIAEAAAEKTRDHFGMLASVRHRSNVETNFYANAARMTTGEVEGNDSVVIVDHIGIAQRFYGGTIRPRTGRYLTIPLSAAAQGKRAREFPELFYLRTRAGKQFLARPKSGGSGVEMMYILKSKVDQRRDPSVLPTRDEYIDAISQELENMQDYI